MIAVQRRQPTHSPRIGPGQDRDQERRREQDRQRLVELEIAERHEVEHGRAEQQHRAAELQRRPPGAQQARPVDRIGEHQRDQERAGVAHADHLRYRHVGAEIFRHAVEAGEGRHRAAHQPDAGEPLAAVLVRGVGQYVARPPEMSNTAPVENEQSAEAQKATSAAISVDLDETAARNFRQHVVDVLLRHLVEDRGAGRGRRDAIDRDVVAARAPCRAIWSAR